MNLNSVSTAGNPATSPILKTRRRAQPVTSPLSIAPLADRFGRVHTDLRVSLTDRCNLRCTYCMPAEGRAWLPRAEVLTDDEVVCLVRIAIRRLGHPKIRLTGGEPLLRRGLPGLVARLHGRGLAHRRHRRGGRHHRQCHPRILRQLRPGAAHRRRSVAQLLFATEESNLQALLRGGADDGAIEHAWRVGRGQGSRPCRQQHSVPPPRTPHVSHWAADGHGVGGLTEGQK